MLFFSISLNISSLTKREQRIKDLISTSRSSKIRRWKRTIDTEICMKHMDTMMKIINDLKTTLWKLLLGFEGYMETTLWITKHGNQHLLNVNVVLLGILQPMCKVQDHSFVLTNEKIDFMSENSLCTWMTSKENPSQCLWTTSTNKFSNTFVSWYEKLEDMKIATFKFMDVGTSIKGGEETTATYTQQLEPLIVLSDLEGAYDEFQVDVLVSRKQLNLISWKLVTSPSSSSTDQRDNNSSYPF